MEDKNKRALLGWRLDILMFAIAAYREKGQKEADELEPYRERLENELEEAGGRLHEVRWQFEAESEYETV